MGTLPQAANRAQPHESRRALDARSAVARTARLTGRGVDEPNIGERSVWRYQIVDGWNGYLVRGSFTLRVVAATPSRLALQIDGAPEQWIYARPARLLSGSISVRAAGAFDPPLELRPFPLEVGQSWSQTTHGTDAAGAVHRVLLKGRTLGWETIRVPAGELKAIHLRRELYLGDEERFRSETWRVEDEWYVPEMKGPAKLVMWEIARDPTLTRVMQHNLVNRERYELVSFSEE